MEFKNIIGYSKSSSSEVDEGIDFVMSNPTTDRVGEIILPTAWKIENFKKNPICLYQHNMSDPIGIWNDVRIEDDQLCGTLQLAEKGTSPDIDCIRELVRQGILKAVSVGFAVNDYEINKLTGQAIFTDVELMECSLVSVPANPSALAIAKCFRADESKIFNEVTASGAISEKTETSLKRARLAIIQSKRTIRSNRSSTI